MRGVVAVCAFVMVVVLVDRAWGYELARAGGTLSERADYGTVEGIAPIAAPGLSAGRVGDQAQQARSESVSQDRLREPAWGIRIVPPADTGVRGARPSVSKAVSAEPSSLNRISSRGSSVRAKWPTAAAMRWQPPRGFLRQAFCVHRQESVDWYRAYVDWRGRPSRYSGGMQFTLSTWRRAGGLGHAFEWRPREQVYRAFVIWRKYRTADRPGSWFEWGSRGKCGLA